MLEFDGKHYYVETPGGTRWSFDDRDLDEQYAVDALYAWSRVLDFVRERGDA